MKIYKIVFSPTGGTQKVADILAKALNTDVQEIDLSECSFAPVSLEKDATAIIAMPSFGGRAPQIAIERLKQIEGNGANAILAAVYGNREQEDTLIEMADVAKESGFRVVAAVTAIAEHSIAHQFATGRPDAQDAEQLRAFAAQIQIKLASTPDEIDIIPGNRPYKKAGAGLVPKTSSACTNCGICANKCPVGAIDKTNPKRTNKSICINCMRCVAICPNNAKTVNKMMVAAVGVALKKSCSVRKEYRLLI